MQKSTAYYLQVNYKLLKFKYSSSFNGVPERIRTSDTRLRRAVLYPAELLKHEFSPSSQRGDPLNSTGLLKGIKPYYLAISTLSKKSAASPAVLIILEKVEACFKSFLATNGTVYSSFS